MSRQLPLAEHITAAEAVSRSAELLRVYGRDCLDHPELAENLSLYRDGIAASELFQAELGLGAICGECARNDASCCYDGVQLLYDPVMLFINRLLGCEPPPAREIAGVCHFCGAGGCKLTAKLSYCHNYYCPAVEEAVGGANLRLLRATVGRELCLQVDLERLVLARLGRH